MNFKKVCDDIKQLKIQGAENVAIAAVKAYSSSQTKNSYKKLISLRSTEPCLRNALKYFQISRSLEKTLNHLNQAREETGFLAAKLIKNNFTIFTHCHSSAVNNALVQANNEGKKISVNCTETRPFFQGRMTARDMAKARIPVTLFVDSAMRLAIKEADICFIGADAITANGEAINKIGSELAADIAKHYNKPFYVLTDSWKFDPKTLFGYEEEIEERSSDEIWKNPPKGVRISNYVFEKVHQDKIKAIVSELGILPPKKFVNAVIKKYPWMAEL